MMMDTTTSSTCSTHIVIPGQIIATSSAQDEENTFLRGHGTYLENVVNTNDNSATSNIVETNYSNNSNHDHLHGDTTMEEDQDSRQQMHHQMHQPMHQHSQHLVASVTGTIIRTNKLVQITPPNAPYNPQTGDPIIGRITSISNQRWNVSLNLTSNSVSVQASLPLTGIHMPDGIQRIRTNADALAMRSVLQEGDLISAEVRAIQGGSSSSSAASGSSTSAGASSFGTVILHARSVRCGKLENGCFVMAPSWLIGRRKKQFVVLGINNNSNHNSIINTTKNQSQAFKRGFDGILVEVLLGCNGGIWIQLAMMELQSSSSGNDVMIQEKVQRIRSAHANKQMTMQERIVIARVRNAIEALKLVYCKITPENIEAVVASSVELGYDVVDMLRHDVVSNITACTRNKNTNQ